MTEDIVKRCSKYIIRMCGGGNEVEDSEEQKEKYGKIKYSSYNTWVLKISLVTGGVLYIQSYNWIRVLFL